MHPIQRRILVNPATRYLLEDTFTQSLPAGSVNGTRSDSGHLRTVVDTGANLSIAGGVLLLSGGGAVKSLGYAWTTATGQILLASLYLTPDLGGPIVGWNQNLTTGIAGALLKFANYSQELQFRTSSLNLSLGTWTSAVVYKAAIARRSVGAQILVRGGTQYPSWTLLWVDAVETSCSVPYTRTDQTSGTVTHIQYMRIPPQLWLPAPLVSEGMSGTNGTALSARTSDGQGHAEVTGVGSGGTGGTWIDALGSWSITSNTASASTFSASSNAIAIVDCGQTNVLHSAAVTEASANVGIVVRYSASSDYVYAVYTGASAQLIKRVSNTETTVISAGAASAANAVLRVVADSTSFGLYYNNAKIGSTSTVSDATLQSGTYVGLYTGASTNTCASMTTYARSGYNVPE